MFVKNIKCVTKLFEKLHIFINVYFSSLLLLVVSEKILK